MEKEHCKPSRLGCNYSGHINQGKSLLENRLERNAGYKQKILNGYGAIPTLKEAFIYACFQLYYLLTEMLNLAKKRHQLSLLLTLVLFSSFLRDRSIDG